MVINAEESGTIEITVEHALADEMARAESAGKRVVLVRDGVRYRVEPVDEAAGPRPPTRSKRDPWADYDPDKLREGIEAAAGSWSDVDAEQIKEYIYAGRELGTRLPDRP